MGREFYIAFCFSLAIHAAVVSVCPAPHAASTGENGEKQEIVVLGVVELRFPPHVEMEQSEPPEPVADLAEAVVEDLVEPDTAVDPDPFWKHEEVALLPQEHKDKEEQGQKPAEQTTDPPPDVPSMGQEGKPGQPELTQGQLKDIQSQYLRRVLVKLQKAKRYPLQAYSRGIEGAVEIKFGILGDGRTQEVQLRTSSGYRVLDQAVMDMIHRASPFEPLPEELRQKRMELAVPVVFKIE